MQDGLRRMYRGRRRDVFYYITRDERELRAARPCRKAPEEGILQGMYRLREGGGSGKRASSARAAAGLRHHPARGDRRGGDAGEGLRRVGRRLERDQLHRAAPRRHGRASAGTCCTRQTSRARRYVDAAWAHAAGPIIAATDYMRLFADQIRPCVPGRTTRARHRRLRPHRHAGRAARVLRGGPPVHRAGERSRRWPTRGWCRSRSVAEGDRARTASIPPSRTR